MLLRETASTTLESDAVSFPRLQQKNPEVGHPNLFAGRGVNSSVALIGGRVAEDTQTRLEGSPGRKHSRELGERDTMVNTRGQKSASSPRECRELQLRRVGG